MPTQVRLALAVALALVAFQAAGTARVSPLEISRRPLLAAVLGESLIGVSAGMAARFAIEAASAAGHAAGLSMGIGFAAVIDPLHGADSTALSELLVFLALAVALAAGMHREAIAWLCRSVIETPPGSAVSIAEVSSAVVAEAARAAALAIRLAFPVMAAVLFGYVGPGPAGPGRAPDLSWPTSASPSPSAGGRGARSTWSRPTGRRHGGSLGPRASSSGAEASTDERARG